VRTAHTLSAGPSLRPISPPSHEQDDSLLKSFTECFCLYGPGALGSLEFQAARNRLMQAAEVSRHLPPPRARDRLQRLSAHNTLLVPALGSTSKPTCITCKGQMQYSRKGQMQGQPRGKCDAGMWHASSTYHFVMCHAN